MSLHDLRAVSRIPAGPPPLYVDPDAAISTHALESGLLDLHLFGLQPGVSTGWASLDPFYTIKPGHFTVVTGIPHSGKSPFVLQLLMHCRQTHNWKVAISSPEHVPYDNLLAHLYQQYFRCSLTELTRAELMMANDELNNKLFFLPPSETLPTIPHVLDCCLPLVEQDLRGLVIDPYGEYEHRRPAGMTETEYVSQLLIELRRFARTHAVHIWLIAHPMKMQKREDGTYPIVKPYDIAGSAHFYNKPDNILSIYRDDDFPDRTQIHIQKIKFREIGTKGMVTLRHDAKTGTFYDLSAETEPEK